MALTMHLFYTGKNGSAAAFVKEMEESGTAALIRQEPGNLGYAYYQSLADPETILLLDSWQDQEALDRHHASAMMQKVMELREKYDLDMQAERYIRVDNPSGDQRFLRQKEHADG